jgi:O-antigen ligase
MSNRTLSRALPTAALLGAAVAVGAIVARAPTTLSVVAVVVLLAFAGLIVLRVAVTPPTGSRAPLAVDVAHEDPRLRPARVSYYLGAATIGFLTVRPAMDFTASDWIFLGSLGVAALVVGVQGLTPDYLIPRAVTVGVLLFALGGLLSSLEAVDSNASALVVLRMLYLTLVWFWLGTLVLETPTHVQNALVAWVGSVAVSSSGAIAQFFYGDVISGGTIAWGRMTGFTGHFNILGGLAATAFVPALMLAVDSPRRAVRVAGTVSTALIAAGLLLSGSVGGLIAATVATMVWLALRGVSLRILVSGAAVAVAAFGLMSATGSTNSPSPVDRIQRVTSAEEAGTGTGGTIYTRLEGYSVAWSRIVEQPLVGVGLDLESSEEALGRHTVHNLILGPWFTAGVLGVVGIVMLIVGALATGLRVLRNTPPQHRSFTAALLASLVAFIEHAMGEPILFVRYGWFPTALLIALHAQHIRARAHASRAASVDTPPLRQRVPAAAIGARLARPSPE